MRVYLRSLTSQCSHPGCTEQATVRLVVAFPEFPLAGSSQMLQNSLGDYCMAHGGEALREYQREHEEAHGE